MKPELNPLEARIVGCLIEKEITTPDQYPLTLNALVHAANQKSNRDPVLNLGERDVQDVLDGLMKKHLVTDRSGAFGGRVTRYRHRFCNTQFGELTLSPEELAVNCELLLRGPQTPGAAACPGTGASGGPLGAPVRRRAAGGCRNRARHPGQGCRGRPGRGTRRRASGGDRPASRRNPGAEEARGGAGRRAGSLSAAPQRFFRPPPSSRGPRAVCHPPQSRPAPAPRGR